MNCPECCEKEIEVLCRCKRCQWYWRPKISVERLEAAIKEPPREGEYGAMNKLIAAYDEYIAAYDEYIALLGAELDELSGFAATHGWKSTRYEAGRLCRRKIESAKITAKIAEGK